MTNNDSRRYRFKLVESCNSRMCIIIRASSNQSAFGNWCVHLRCLNDAQLHSFGKYRSQMEKGKVGTMQPLSLLKPICTPAQSLCKFLPVHSVNVDSILSRWWCCKWLRTSYMCYSIEVLSWIPFPFYLIYLGIVAYKISIDSILLCVLDTYTVGRMLGNRWMQNFSYHH